MSATPPADFLAFLQVQRDRYRRDLPGRIAEVEEAWARFNADPTAVDQLTHLERLAHNLAGSSGTFGFPELGAAASALEQDVRQWSAQPDLDDAVQRRRIGAAVSLLRQTLPPEGIP